LHPVVVASCHHVQVGVEDLLAGHLADRPDVEEGDGALRGCEQGCLGVTRDDPTEDAARVHVDDLAHTSPSPGREATLLDASNLDPSGRPYPATRRHLASGS